MQNTPEIITNDAPLTGTIFKNNNVIHEPEAVLTAMTSGRILQGWYGFLGQVVGDFELEPPRSRSGKIMRTYGDGQRVSGNAVKHLVDQGLIQIPAQQGRNNRLAVARLIGVKLPDTVKNEIFFLGDNIKPGKKIRMPKRHAEDRQIHLAANATASITQY